MAYSAPLGDVDELLWLLTATTLMFRKGPQGRPSPRVLSRATSRETQNDFRTLLNHTGTHFKKPPFNSTETSS